MKTYIKVAYNNNKFLHAAPDIKVETVNSQFLAETILNFRGTLQVMKDNECKLYVTWM